MNVESIAGHYSTLILISNWFFKNSSWTKWRSFLLEYWKHCLCKKGSPQPVKLKEAALPRLTLMIWQQYYVLLFLLVTLDNTISEVTTIYVCIIFLWWLLIIPSEVTTIRVYYCFYGDSWYYHLATGLPHAPERQMLRDEWFVSF